MNDWFDIDRAGLAAILERRGKAFLLYELLSNAFDAGATRVAVRLEPVPHAPRAVLIVEGDAPGGWGDLAQAYTLFARSSRAADASKRGRFNLGEKLVLALAHEAVIETTTGTLEFAADGRRTLHRRSRERGTRIQALLRMMRDELDAVLLDAQRIIPPVTVTVNDVPLVTPPLLKRFEVTKLPTEIADAEGNLRRTFRSATVEAYAADDGGDVLELGIPVARADWPWRLNVLQKVPLNLERDAVTDAFRRALQVAALNALSPFIDSKQATAAWVSESLGDARVAPEVLKTVITQRFGERVVVATPGDPLASAQAEAAGYAVLHGGTLSAAAWSNVRKHGAVVPASAAFPTPKAEALAAQAGSRCPLCGR